VPTCRDILNRGETMRVTSLVTRQKGEGKRGKNRKNWGPPDTHSSKKSPEPALPLLKIAVMRSNDEGCGKKKPSLPVKKGKLVDVRVARDRRKTFLTTWKAGVILEPAKEDDRASKGPQG